MRLAKYNITPKDKLVNYFYGLPTTVSGGVLASFILLYRRYTKLPPPFLFLVLVLTLAFLMVSKVKYPNLDALKKLLLKNKAVFLGITLILSVVLIGFYLITSKFLPEITIFTLFLIYLLFSPFIGKLSEIK